MEQWCGFLEKSERELLLEYLTRDRTTLLQILVSTLSRSRRSIRRSVSLSIEDWACWAISFHELVGPFQNLLLEINSFYAPTKQQRRIVRRLAAHLSAALLRVAPGLWWNFQLQTYRKAREKNASQHFLDSIAHWIDWTYRDRSPQTSLSQPLQNLLATVAWRKSLPERDSELVDRILLAMLLARPESWFVVFSASGLAAREEQRLAEFLEAFEHWENRYNDQELFLLRYGKVAELVRAFHNQLRCV